MPLQEGIFLQRHYEGIRLSYLTVLNYLSLNASVSSTRQEYPHIFFLLPSQQLPHSQSLNSIETSGIN